MAVESVYFNSKMYEILKGVPGDNVSQKLKYIIEAFAEQRE